MKKILVITSSLRPDSNSEILADSFIRGAEEAGHEVEKISLKGKTINFCTGCLVCQKTQRCVIHDDADAIAQKMKVADVLVFATPVYYYEMSGKMKSMLDRANPLFPSDYSFRDVYLLASAAEDAEETIDGALAGLNGWIRCFGKSRLAGSLLGGGVTNAGEMRGKDEVLAKAFAMGKNA